MSININIFLDIIIALFHLNNDYIILSIILLRLFHQLLSYKSSAL